MTISRRPSPFGELLSLRQAMDRLFEESFVRPRGAWGAGGSDGMPLALDISTTADAVIVEAALPGVRPEDVEITVEDGVLFIRGGWSERKQAEGDYLVQEIRRGEASRSISLPSGLEPDRAEASFEHGVLTLRIPKAEQVKPRQIRINTGSQARGDSPHTEDRTVAVGAGHGATGGNGQA